MVAMESYGIGCKVVTKKSDQTQTLTGDRVIRDYISTKKVINSLGLHP